MKKLQLLILVVMLILLLILGCGSDPTPIVISTPVPSAAEVIAVKERRDTTHEITQQKIFDQCDSASGFKAQVQFSQSSGQESREELVLIASVGGEAGVGDLAPGVKVKIEGAIEQHYASAKNNNQGHQEGVFIEVQPYTKQEYNIVWREIRRIGTVEYIENSETKTASYDYRIGLELLNATGKDLQCPGSEGEDEGGTISDPQPTYTPLPTYTPYPTPEPTHTPVPVPTATYTPLPPPTDAKAMGEAWIVDGVSLTLDDIDFHRGDFAELSLTLRNKSSNAINFQYDLSTDIKVIDNNGTRYKYEGCFSGLGACAKSDNLEAGDTNWPFRPRFSGPFADQNVDYIIVTANISRLENASWKVPMYH